MLTKQDLFENKLEDYQTNGFWVRGNIPQNKLENAIAHFPIPINATVFGLIDTTVLGSCKNGLAITNLGIFWKNDWTTKSSKNTLTWNEFREMIGNMCIESYDLHFGKNIRFCMAGSSMKPAQAFHLFHGISDILDRISLPSPQNNNILTNKTNRYDQYSGSANNLYEDTLISALALMSIADGKIDDDEIELVVAFINEEDSISNKDTVLEKYENMLEELTKSREKSNAIFKLKSEKLIINMRKLEDELLINKIKIMLEGMLDIVGGQENTPTTEMMKKIMSSLGR